MFLFSFLRGSYIFYNEFSFILVIIGYDLVVVFIFLGYIRVDEDVLFFVFFEAVARFVGIFSSYFYIIFYFEWREGG